MGGRGSRPFSQSKLQKKKIELHFDYVPCCKSTRARLSGAGPTLRKGAANKSIECLVKEGNTWYKEKQVVEEFSEDDTCHGSRSTQNRKLAFLVLRTSAVPRPRDSRTSRAEATTATVALSDQATSGLSFSVSGATSSEERWETLRDLLKEAAIPQRRTWVLTRSDCSPTTCAPLAVHDSAGKNFNFALGRETYPHAV